MLMQMQMKCKILLVNAWEVNLFIIPKELWASLEYVPILKGSSNCFTDTTYK